MVDYIIKKSLRAKILRISIHSDCSVVVTLPHRMNIKHVERFMKEREGWVNEGIKKMKIRIAKNPISSLPKPSHRDMLEKKDRALVLVQEKLLRFNKIYGLKWNTISIKNTKTRWGSCSKKGNMNFNYRIVYLPESLADYLVVHEMCHLKEMNHSENFWKLVEKAVPEYKNIRKQLKVI